MRSEQKKAACEACGKSPRILTELDSLQWVCRTCLRELRRATKVAKVERSELAIHITPHRGSKSTAQSGKGVHASDSLRFIPTKVAGVTHANRDGTFRQSIVRRCLPGEEVVLFHEPQNPYDKNAIAVHRLNGEQLGYLKAELAEEFVGWTAEGCRYSATVSDITGGWRDDMYFGANLFIALIGPNVPDEEAQQFADELERESITQAEQFNERVLGITANSEVSAEAIRARIHSRGTLRTIIILISIALVATFLFLIARALN